MRFKTRVASVLAATALAAGTLFAAAPAQAAHIWTTSSAHATTCAKATKAKESHLRSQGYSVSVDNRCKKYGSGSRAYYYTSIMYWI